MDFHFSIDDVFESLFDKEHPVVECVNELEYPVDLYVFLNILKDHLSYLS